MCLIIIVEFRDCSRDFFLRSSWFPQARERITGVYCCGVNLVSSKKSSLALGMMTFSFSVNGLVVME